MISIQEIHKRFGKFQVLQHINLQLIAGNVVALIGPNACGKTTLIKTILGMVLPDKGTITVNGQPVHTDWAYRKHIGYMPQMGRYPENMSVAQILDMLQNLRQVDQPDLELYEGFQLKDILHKKMGTLSGGTRQKIGAHLAFAFRPDILILDEPTAGLDPLSAVLLKHKIQQERDKGKLILITSHILSELDGLVNQVVYMQDGQILFDKTFEDLVRDTGTSRLSDAIVQIMASPAV